MTTASAASDVARRFSTERDYVERYVQLVQAKSTLHDRQVLDLNRILTRVQIVPLPTRHFDRIGKPFSTDEIVHLLKAMREISPGLYQTILGYEQRLDDIPSPLLNSPAADFIDQLGEWVDYFVDRLSDEPSDDEINSAIRSAFEEASLNNADVDEDDQIPPDALNGLLVIASTHACHAKIRQRVDEMVYVREQFADVEVLARMAAPDAEINVLRQGFILLMTAFDAAVFDLTRIAFCGKFFELIKTFGKHEKVSLESLGEAGSFETFREQVIEVQLKKRYVKDLVLLLPTFGVTCVDAAAGDRVVHLVELVLRRNIHVHNRGIVDDRYLEVDATTGKAQYNLFNLKHGDAAAIDASYFKTAIRLCDNCIKGLQVWCDT